MSFEMAPNNFEFDFEQKFLLIRLNPQIEQTFQDDRDPDLNYFYEVNIPSKETTYINETDIKNFLYETQRFENVSVLHAHQRTEKQF